MGHLSRPLHGRLHEPGGATWLQIDARPGDRRPVVAPTLGPTWGLHLDDVNLALGNLVDDVAAAEATYRARPPVVLTGSTLGRPTGAQGRR